jgi:hypothetical protein
MTMKTLYLSRQKPHAFLWDLAGIPRPQAMHRSFWPLHTSAQTMLKFKGEAGQDMVSIALILRLLRFSAQNGRFYASVRSQDR